MSKPQSAYVYRTVREGNRVRRTYLGPRGDPVVQTLEEFRDLGRATAEAAEREVARELQRLEAVDACLQLSGSWSHRTVRNLRKRWRRVGRKRIRRISMPELDITADEYDALVADAADGDETALAELRELLADNPGLCRLLGDLSGHVQRQLIELAADGAIDVREAMASMLSDQRDKLLAAGDSLPERLLVDQILSTMLDAAVCQLGSSQPHAKESIARRWERRLTRAQERHQAAIRSLVEVRQMLEASDQTDAEE